MLGPSDVAENRNRLCIHSQEAVLDLFVYWAMVSIVRWLGEAMFDVFFLVFKGWVE
jgi:hypothetical protein